MLRLARLLLFAVAVTVAWTFRDRLENVGLALKTAGWTGIATVTAYHLLPMGLCGLAWRSLLPGGRATVFILGRWVRDGVGNLAGFLPLSGEMAGARLLACRGIRPATAGALTVVDVTAEVLAQFIFSVLGLVVWMTRHPTGEVARWALMGVGGSVPVLVAFVVVQRSTAVRFLETLPARLMPKTWEAPDAEAGVHAAIARLWADRCRVGRAVAVHLAAWLVSTGEAWLALGLLGHRLTGADVLALESVVFALRSAAFIVPSGLGVQEGGYVVVGAALGLPPELALGLSLLKRGREITVGLPALFAWHVVERRARRSLKPL